ncbi:MAG: hypothetical protein LBD86_03340 [Spirochaetaceae bacterium]|jgi:hypothetical protein|nr:hypothetical protein [Spirochaetaceae bacterium]
MLLLELGVGFNSPVIIRHEFEFLFMMRKYAGMIRINLNVVEISLNTCKIIPIFLQLKA